jgi:hypothetical protein
MENGGFDFFRWRPGGSYSQACRRHRAVDTASWGGGVVATMSWTPATAATAMRTVRNHIVMGLLASDVIARYIAHIAM